MMIVGFDQAPKGIAYAYGEPGAIPTRGFHPLPDYGDATALLGESVDLWVQQFCKSIGAERIFFEQVLPNRGWNTDSITRQFAVVCNIETAARMLGLKHEVKMVGVDDWRREFYAGGRPPKGCENLTEVWKEMALVECARRGWLIDEPFPEKRTVERVAHDIAEACGIWDFGCKWSDKEYAVRSRVVKRRQQSKLDKERNENA